MDLQSSIFKRVQCLRRKLRIDFPDRAFDSKAIHEASVLFRCDLPGFFRGSGPLEAAPRGETFVEKAGSVSFEDESLDPVCASSAEKKKRSFFQCIKAIVETHVRGQAVYSPPEIDAAAADYCALESNAVPKHCGGPP